jgi:peptide/nickel transport system permease protein
VPVAQLVAERLPTTMMLTLMAILISLALALPLAFVAALRAGHWQDLAVRGSLQIGLSSPIFFLGLLLLSLLGVLRAEHVAFARSKGLPERTVMRSHVLRPAAAATVSLVGLHIGALLGGAVVTETVFAVPGVGRLMVDSIFARDYPVVQGLTLVLALLVSACFLATDLVVAWLDPRATQRRRV